MYFVIALTNSFVTLKAFLPITTGSMKLMSVDPGEDYNHKTKHTVIAYVTHIL